MHNHSQRILVVDPHPQLAAGLRHLLRSRRPGAQVDTAHDPETVEREFAGGGVDALVTDLAGPGKAAHEAILASARRDHPRVVRIALVGSAADAAAVPVDLAHRVVLRPCRDESVLEAIERAAAVRDLLAQPALHRKIGAIDTLPVAPAIYAELSQALLDPEVSARDVAEIVAADPGLSARLLQLVNSSAFGLTRPMSSVLEGVTYLGIGSIRNLALTVGVLEQLDIDSMPGCFSLQAEWAHGIVAARLAAKIAPRGAAEDAFLAGMLHDLGNLVMAAKLPDDFTAARQHAIAHRLPLDIAEWEVHGFDHGQVGAYVLSSWGLRQSVIEAVAHHHRPSAVDTDTFDALGAVHVADLLAQRRADELDRDYLTRTGMLEAAAEWERVADVMLELAEV